MFQKSEIIIKLQEVERLKILLSDSLAYKQYFYEEKLEDDDSVFEDDFLDDDVEGDDFCNEAELSDDEF